MSNKLWKNKCRNRIEIFNRLTNNSHDYISDKPDYHLFNKVYIYFLLLGIWFDLYFIADQWINKKNRSCAKMKLDDDREHMQKNNALNINQFYSYI